jgi:hypothetical protein
MTISSCSSCSSSSTQYLEEARAKRNTLATPPQFAPAATLDPTRTAPAPESPRVLDIKA